MNPFVRPLFLVLASTLSCGLNAQVDLDSLRAVANNPSLPDSVRFSAHFDLVWEGYLFSAPDTAFTMGQQLQRDARASGNKGFEARASELLAATWYVRGDLKTTLLHYDTALAQHTANKDRDGMADVITNMASMRSALGERDEALRLYAEGLRIHEAIMDSAGIANDLNAIGVVHAARGDHARAMDFFVRSLSLQEALGNKRGISTGRANLGMVHVNQGDFASGLVHYREALRVAEELDDRHLMGKDMEEVGACLLELGDTASAMDYFQRSLAVREKLEDQHGLVNVRNRIGYLLMARYDAQHALVLFEQSALTATLQELPRGLAIALTGKGEALLTLGRNAEALVAATAATKAAAKAEDLSAQRDAADMEHRVLRALHRWEEALIAQSLYITFSDSLLREENQRAVLRNEYKYTYEKQALVDSAAHALSTQQETVRTEQRMTIERSRRNIALAFGALFAVALFAIWQRARLLKRTNAAILAAQAKLIESERQREASDVRTRIASDVHDQLGSDLTKLVMLSGEMKEIATGDPSIMGTAADIERVAGEANRSLGDIVWAIDPHHDSLAGLTERVRAHCERMLKWSKVEHAINCDHMGEDRALDPATKRDIYLLLREALNNAIKYSKAQHIAVTFRTDAQRAFFEVKDDGVGFVEENNRGHGLENMRQRAARIGGTLTIESQAGTTVRLGLSLPA